MVKRLAKFARLGYAAAMVNTLFPVILAGGSGTRLWPLSRRSFPKQFLPLYTDQTLLQETLVRAKAMATGMPIIITHHDHRFIVAEQVAEMEDVLVVLEPSARNTAIAIASTAEIVLQQNPHALLWVMPADHVIENESVLHSAVKAAEAAAADGHLVTFGIPPHFAATGYGYIAKGQALADAEGVWQVQHFVEKPALEEATGYLGSGEWLWNSGIFLFRADVYLSELQQFAPKIAAAARQSVQQARREENTIYLSTAPYSTSPSRSIDYAVMEHTIRAAVVPCNPGWSDVGSWDALWDISAKDENGNVQRGNTVLHASEGCYLHSEGPVVATCGLKDIVVVAARDAVLVSSRHYPQEIKTLLAQMDGAGLSELSASPLTHRPWGSYEVLMEGAGFKVKKIIVHPGKQLSLQRHAHRSEHWTVVRGAGTAEIVEDGRSSQYPMPVNTSLYIPAGAVHRLINSGEEVLEMIEVQCGSYLGEDDIERFADDYGRSTAPRRVA